MSIDLSSLTSEEKKEAEQYNNIYYIGNNNKNIDGDKDKQNRYLCYPQDQIYFRYEILSKCGKGAFSNVVRVFDHKYKQKKIIKIIRDEKRFHKQAKIEYEILNKINTELPKEKSIIHLLKTFQFRDHICFVFEDYYSNLYEFMNKNKISLATVKNYTLQLLQGLKYLEDLGIIHADFKPENIMIRDEKATDVIIIDFGSSFYKKVVSKNFYVQSRWYRAPEVLLNYPNFDTKIDLWSLGCIVFEIAYNNLPLFNGKNHLHQLYKIKEVLGDPPLELLDVCEVEYSIYDFSKFPESRVRNFNFIQDKKLVEFLQKVLQWCPWNRIDIVDAFCLLLD